MKGFEALAAPDQLWGNTISNMGLIDSNPKRYATDLMRICLSAQVPVILWGPPGASKTETIKSMGSLVDAEGKHFKVKDIQPSTEDPTTIHGLKAIETDSEGRVVTIRTLPQMVQDIIDNYEDGHLTILLLDEMTTAMLSQQHALLKFVTSGVFGEHDISGMVTIAMAGNPQGTVDVSRSLDKQFLNRAAHIPWVSQGDEWLENWGNGFGGKIPKPPHNIQREMSGLFKSDPKNVFRSLTKSWTFDSLVPYDRLELSERSAYLYAQVSEVVDRVSGAAYSVNPDIKWRYKRSLADAILGKKWGGRMGTVLAAEQENVGFDTELRNMVAGGRFADVSTQDEVVKLTLPLLEPQGKRIRSEQLNDSLESISEELKNSVDGGKLTGDDVTVMWVTLASLKEQERTLFDTSLIFKVILEAKKLGLEDDGVVAIPSYAPQDVKDLIAKTVGSL